MSKQGFVQLHRALLDWEWYSDHNTTRLFIHMLLRANHKDNKWQGILVSKGSFISGRKQLSLETGLSEQQIRTSILRLKSTSELTIKTTKKYSIYSMVKWDSYQGKQPTKQPTTNQQLTTNNNDNNDNKIYRAAGFDIFWELYPRQRRGDKIKSYDAYCKALEKDTPENILDGLKAYSKSDEVKKGYAKGCQAWLNDSRWLNDYDVGAKPTPLFDKDKIVLW